MAELERKENHGQCILLISAPKKQQLYAVRQTLKEAFPDLQNAFMHECCGVFTFETKYTTEETLYPLLEEAKKEIIYGGVGGKIIAFSVFLDGMYTEKIVIFENIDEFMVDPIREATEEEKKSISTYYQLFKRLKAVESVRDWCKNGNIFVHELRGEPLKQWDSSPEKKEIAERILEKFEKVNRESYESLVNCGHWAPMVTGMFSENGSIPIEAYTDGKGHVYFFDAIHYPAIAYYIPFERFFFLKKEDMKKGLKGGYSITWRDKNDELFLVYAGIWGESTEDYLNRVARDKKIIDRMEELEFDEERVRQCAEQYGHTVEELRLVLQMRWEIAARGGNI